MILDNFYGLKPLLFDEVPPEDGAPGGDDAEPDETPEDDDVDTGDDGDDDDEDGDDAEDAQTQALLAALSNPATRKATILALAENEGIKLTADTTQKQVKAAAKSIKEIFEETLGEDLDLLPSKGAKLLEAIEKIVGTKVDEINSDLQQRDNKALVNEAGKVYEKLGKDKVNYPRLGEVDQLMGELIREYPLGANQSIEDHMTEMYALACRRADKLGTKNKPKNDKERNRRAIQNRERIVPPGTGGKQATEKVSPIKITSREAVKAAMIELQQKARKAR